MFEGRVNIEFDQVDIRITVDGREVFMKLRECVACGALIQQHRMQWHADFHGRVGK